MDVSRGQGRFVGHISHFAERRVIGVFLLIAERLKPGIEQPTRSRVIALPQLVPEVATHRDPGMQHAPISDRPGGENNRCEQERGP